MWLCSCTVRSTAGVHAGPLEGAALALTVILLTVQSMLMLLEPPLWLVWADCAVARVAALNSREMLLSVKKLLHRA